MGGLDSFCQIKSSTNGTTDPAAEAALFQLKSTFRTIIVVISALGVAGNILNLVTLRSPSLRNVPFMFIRALALFDLISLVAILLLFTLEALQIEMDAVIFYEVWVQDVLINSFLVAGLYCAVLLTIERFLLIRKPLSTGARLLSIENTVLVKIGMALLGAIILHTPMALQWQAKCAQYSTTEGNGNGVEFDEEKSIEDVEGGGGGSGVHCLHWSRGKFNNRALLCRDPFFALYNYYKMGRELLRFFCVLLLIFLNAVIARHLQMAKRKRRLLIKRVSMVTTATSEASGEKQQQQPQQNGQHQNTVKRISPPHIDRSRKDQLNILMRSFTEKKLTALMVAICVIFAIGNIPQMVVMAVQNEALESSYSFQVFRQVANTAEVLNHCLNFFIFCMASSEYCRAFLSLSPVRWCLRHFPICASLARARLNGRLDNSHLVINCMGPNESASDCLNTQRKKSSLGTVLASSEIGWSSMNGNNGGGHCPAAGAAAHHRYRRDGSSTSILANGQQRSSQWSQRSLVGAALIVERKSSSTLLTNVASAEWPSTTAGPQCAATVQLIGPPSPQPEGMSSSSGEESDGNENGNGGVTVAGGGDDDFL